MIPNRLCINSNNDTFAYKLFYDKNKFNFTNSWINFNEATLMLMGTPGISDKGTDQITIVC